MADRYIAFDVETPNALNHRMSAIGIAVVENGKLAETFGTLVNPETRFDWFNIQLTGITPETVEDAPTFPQLWEQIRPMMESGVLLAHNAPFDMGVLAKCLRDYDIFWKPAADYACTCRMGRRCYPQFPNHKLNTMCQELAIPLRHHDAASDAEACAKLLVSYLEQGFNPKPYIRTFQFGQ